MTTPRQVAEAFSGHRFHDAYGALAPDVRWTSVGAGVLIGRQAVVDACEATLAELARGTAQFLRFVVIADADAVAVDAVGRYVDADGEVSLVSCCDIYAFADGVLTSITSYTVELDPTAETQVQRVRSSRRTTSVPPSTSTTFVREVPPAPGRTRMGPAPDQCDGAPVSRGTSTALRSSLAHERQRQAPGWLPGNLYSV
jgi:ketosteroid isomerase-like protein